MVLTLSRVFETQISKYATGNPHALSMTMNVFDHQDSRIPVWRIIAQRALKLLMEELNRLFNSEYESRAFRAVVRASGEAAACSAS
jgi:hypothetical protein